MAEDDIKTESVEQTAVENQPATEDFSNSADNDPMIIAMREAEAQIKEAEQQNSEEGEAQADPATEKTAPVTTEQKTDVLMIPKPRLDEVILERDKAKDQVAYLQGIVDTQRSMIKDGVIQKTDAPAGKTEEKPQEPTIKTQIADAEAKKLELAQQYEDGEISLTDMKKAEIDIDRQIRELTETLYKAVSEETRQAANADFQTQLAIQAANTEALKIEQEHPYVKEIDNLPKEVAQRRWEFIREEAQSILQAKGVQPFVNGVETVAYMKEIAKLTDVYGPAFTGKDIKASDTKPKQPNVSAEERAGKIALSNRQPPSLATAGAEVVQNELSEQDILNMTLDQIADMNKLAPNKLNKAVGFK